MFEAFLLVCAASLDGGIDMNRCLYIDDTLGPFVTEENCKIRVDQMVKEMLLEDELNQYIIRGTLGFPPYLAFIRYCEEEKETPI